MTLFLVHPLDSRERRILEMAARIGIVVLNTESKPTFRRRAFWVGGRVTNSGRHLGKWLPVQRVPTVLFVPTPPSTGTWNVARVKIEIFAQALRTGKVPLEGISGGGNLVADTV